MNSDWQAFLQQQAASLRDGVVEHFGDAQGELSTAKTCTVMCDLSQFGILLVSGSDSQSFLQKLFSSDVSEISSMHAQYSSFNSAKGRMLATALIWRQHGSDYYLLMPRSLVGTIHNKLTMYVMRSKVKISDASDELAYFGLAGSEAAALVEECFAPPPQQVMGVVNDTFCSMIRLATDRFMFVTTVHHAATLWKCMNDGARPVGSHCWDWFNVRAGIPFILPATEEQFVPQMANLELIGGVGFKKGCYPGQEIVARMQYLGKLKRRMYLAHIEGPAQAGDELYSAEMEGQSCGMVVNAAAAPGGGTDLLAVVQIASHDAHTVHLGSLQGEALQFQPLPYALPA